MKRKITCILAYVMVIATVIPSITLAASNASILDNLTLSGVKTYDVALPTNGTKKTKKQIEDLLKRIPNKPSGKGNTVHKYYLEFRTPNSKKPGNYVSAYISKEWSKYIDKTKKSFFYNEYKDLIDTKAGITCCIEKADTKYIHSYYWINGEKTGEHFVFNIDLDYNNYVNYFNYKLYPDATVLGEKCMVFSYDYHEYIDIDETGTYYQFVSRKTGLYIKYIDVNEYDTYTLINFEQKQVDKTDSFFDPPKDVKFKTREAGAAYAKGLITCKAHPRMPSMPLLP